MELDRVLVGPAHDGSALDVHPGRDPRAHVLLELLDVLGDDLGRDFQLQNDPMVDLEVQASGVHGHGARHCENIHLGEARDVSVVQLDLQQPLVHGLGAARAVPRHDLLRARPYGLHEARWLGQLRSQVRGPHGG